MDDRFEPKDPSRRVKGVLIVIVLHALLAYALVSGLARKGLNAINKPLEAVVIQEVIIPPSTPPAPPPPAPAPKETRKPQEVLKREAPPPPSVPPSDVAPEVSSTAPVVASVAPAPSPLAAPGPKRTSIGLVCPTQVPRKALQEGIEGVVKAQIHVKDGTILDVTVLSGPRVFHAAVKAAMLQYRCVTDGGEVTATQEFTFRLE
jgi:periplasmic protein TonB